MAAFPPGARGRFVTFEGLDGAGKSTHLAWAAERLRARLGADRLVVTREPGGTKVGERLRDLLLNEPMHADTEALLMFAARREHLARVIEPALGAGQWVLSDRFTDASYAYQAGGRGIAVDRLAALERFTHPALQPDLTIVFDVDPATAEARRAGARDADRFEAEARAFHERVRAAYLARAAAEPGRVRIVRADREIGAIQTELEELLAKL